MSTTALTVATKFLAIDKMTAPIRKMQSSMTKFTKKTSDGLARIQRRERAVRKGFSKLTGKLGQLGLAFGALAIATTVAKANIELDASLASLQAITGVTTEQFKSFSAQVGQVAKAQKEFAGDTAKAFEIVASAQPVLLKNADALGAVTNAAITLSKASGDDLATSAASLTGVMNQFNLQADQATRVMNTLAAGSVVGSANITNVASSMKNFGAVASGANIQLEEAVALVEVMGSKSIFAEEAGTKLSAAIINLQNAGLGYKSGVFDINDALTEMRGKLDSVAEGKKRDAMMIKIFKKTGITTGQILMEQIGLYDELKKGVTGTNTAVDQMNTKANTLQQRFKELKNAFLNQVTTTDSSNKAMQKIKDTMVFLADNMDKVVKIVWTAIKVFLIYKAIMIVLTTVQAILNVVMLMNPIGLIIIAIIALIALVTIIIKKYHEWGAAFTLIMGPLGMIINLVQSFRRNWEMVKTAFKEKGILGGLLAIGKVILDSILMPVQQLLKLLSKIPGIGKRIAPAVEKLQEVRDRLGVNVTTDERGEPLNPEAAVEQVRTERTEKTKNEKVEIGVTAMQGASAEVLQNTGANINLSNTLGWQQNQ